MKLTPLDIHHKEFRHALRGYSEEEVDAFLDSVADEFERLFKENIDLNEKLEAANERVRGYQAMEATLNNTLVTAQRAAEDIVAKAGHEADTMLRDAEMKAKELVHDALQKKHAVSGELVRIKQAEEEFRSRYRAQLETQLASVNEVELPDDVSVMLGETGEGVVGDVALRPVARETAVFESAQVSAPADMPEPAGYTVAGQAEPMPQSDEGSVESGATDDDLGPVASSLKFDEPETAQEATKPVVESLTLGEIGEPDIPGATLELEEPIEYILPGLDALGEREDDLDIEEID